MPCASITRHTIQVTLAAFLDRYAVLGKMNSSEKTSLMGHLRGRLAAKGTLTEAGWPSVLVKPFAIADISDEVATHVDEWKKEKKCLGSRRTITRCDPDHFSVSEAGGAPMDDGRTVLIKSTTPGTPKHHYQHAEMIGRSDTVATWQLTGDATKNEDKVVSSSSHLLYDDPCRRFVFGVTIEHGRMRLWYFCRSHISVSEGFDVHQNPEPFIEFLVFLNFATTVELGYDPTVKRVLVDETFQYQFKVGRSTYQTVNVIDDAAAADIVTRATRVFAVTPMVVHKRGKKSTLTATGDVCVLRDSWLSTGTDTDRDIQHQMYAALSHVEKDLVAGRRPDLEAEIRKAKDGQASLLPASGELVEDAKKYFMTILADEAVKVDKDEDNAAAIPTIFEEFAYTPHPTESAMWMPYGSMRSVLDGTDEPLGPVAAVLPQSREHTARTHRRSIFKELCTPLSDVVNYSTFALALAQVIIGLNYMRLAGFVHRDISPTNCLLHVDSRQVKISDLEYGRLYVSSSLYGSPLTGTPEFMAVEYQRRRHLFQPHRISTSVPAGASRREKLAIAMKRVVPRAWFRYNFLHDLESVAWMNLWFLFTKMPSCLSLEDPEVRAACIAIEKEYHEIFNRNLEGPVSRGFFLTSRRLVTDTSCCVLVWHVLNSLYSLVPDQDGESLLLGFDAFGDLMDAYIEVEASDPVDLDKPELTRWESGVFSMSCYTTMWALFDEIRRDLTTATYTAIRRGDDDLTGKRRATEPPDADADDMDRPRSKRVRAENWAA